MDVIQKMFFKDAGHVRVAQDVKIISLTIDCRASVPPLSGLFGRARRCDKRDMIVQTIQLALAPVFVLVAIGNILNILSTRLGRVVDRARVLQRMHIDTQGPEHDMVVREIRVVDRRIGIITRAIRIMVLSGLSIGTTVILLFLDGLAGIDLHVPAAITFLGSVVLLLAALVLFLRETQIAAEALRIPRDYLELDRDI